MCGKPIQHTRESPCGDSTHHALTGRWVPWRAKIETNLEQIKTNQNLLRFVHEIGISRLSGKLVGAGVNPSESEKEEFFINDSPQSASKTLDFGIERFCGGVG